MSNYYYDNKDDYLAALSHVRRHNHDLTPFLNFALKGIAKEVSRLTGLLRKEVQKELFRNLMNDLFTRLESTRKRVIVKCQIMLLNHLLEKDSQAELRQLIMEVVKYCASRKHVDAAILRDSTRLQQLGAVVVKPGSSSSHIYIEVDLDWPGKITSSEFFKSWSNCPNPRRMDSCLLHAAQLLIRRGPAIRIHPPLDNL